MTEYPTFHLARSKLANAPDFVGGVLSLSALLASPGQTETVRAGGGSLKLPWNLSPDDSLDCALASEAEYAVRMKIKMT